MRLRSAMSFLSVIVDCNACNWGLFLERNEDADASFNNIISAVSAYCNAHLLTSLNNRLLLLAGGIRNREKKLFSNSSHSNNVDVVEQIEYRLRESLMRVVENPEAASSSSHYAAAMSLSICAFQRYKREVIDPVGRVIIINLTKNLSAEQNMLMNLFFSANQQQLEVSVATLGDNVVPILQQACDITSGTHMIATPHNLLQNLLRHCMSTSGECADIFAKKEEFDVDYRATCHCHNQLVNIGYVCSVCITVHCQFRPICSTCNVLFSLGPAQKPMKRKRNGSAASSRNGVGPATTNGVT